MGGVLSLILAEEGLVEAIAPISAPMATQNPLIRYAALIAPFYPRASWAPENERHLQLDPAFDYGYSGFPTHNAVDLQKLIRMTSLLLAVIYVAFISLGLPDSLLGAAWPSMYGELHVPMQIFLFGFVDIDFIIGVCAAVQHLKMPGEAIVIKRADGRTRCRIKVGVHIDAIIAIGVQAHLTIDAVEGAKRTQIIRGQLLHQAHAVCAVPGRICTSTHHSVHIGKRYGRHFGTNRRDSRYSHGNLFIARCMTRASHPLRARDLGYAQRVCVAKAGKLMMETDQLSPRARVGLAVSGGVDSLVMLTVLAIRRRIVPFPIELMLLHLNPGFDPQNHLPLATLAADLGVAAHIEVTDFGPRAFSEENRKKSACFYCAWLRRKRLFDLCARYGLTHLAFGHNADDLAATFFLNMQDPGVSINRKRKKPRPATPLRLPAIL